MRNALTNNPRNLSGGDLPSEFPIRFTGDAIQYLSGSVLINLNDWQWHEEVINGQKHCIITDRLSSEMQYPMG
ncbi:hypothetical protein [Niabella ginsengisoli]|uniref:Uncharacterized protein n=1 Tax=Niabella ginsengisoli TaxID=522298 RepID=A0ABS9SM12_9BACT|nr:hypothetical protein [Niabella ginsengisoli]MCH5599409.1 hypothetical protein [Niabella ginsengisoli]